MEQNAWSAQVSATLGTLTPDVAKAYCACAKVPRLHPPRPLHWNPHLRWFSLAHLRLPVPPLTRQPPWLGRHLSSCSASPKTPGGVSERLPLPALLKIWEKASITAAVSAASTAATACFASSFRCASMASNSAGLISCGTPSVVVMLVLVTVLVQVEELVFVTELLVELLVDVVAVVVTVDVLEVCVIVVLVLVAVLVLVLVLLLLLVLLVVLLVLVLLLLLVLLVVLLVLVLLLLLVLLVVLLVLVLLLLLVVLLVLVLLLLLVVLLVLVLVVVLLVVVVWLDVEDELLVRLVLLVALVVLVAVAVPWHETDLTQTCTELLSSGTSGTAVWNHRRQSWYLQVVQSFWSQRYKCRYIPTMPGNCLRLSFLFLYFTSLCHCGQGSWGSRCARHCACTRRGRCACCWQSDSVGCGTAGCCQRGRDTAGCTRRSTTSSTAWCSRQTCSINLVHKPAKVTIWVSVAVESTDGLTGDEEVPSSGVDGHGASPATIRNFVVITGPELLCPQHASGAVHLHHSHVPAPQIGALDASRSL